MTDDPKELPPPDTASLAYSRSMDYIDGYESGYEAAANQLRAAVAQARAEELERCARIAKEMCERFASPDAIAAAIRKQT